MLNFMNKLTLLTPTDRAVSRLAIEHPNWMPVLEAAVAVAERSEQDGAVAGARVLDEVRAQGGPSWFPNLRILASHGLLRSPALQPGAVGVPTIGCPIAQVSREPSKRGGAMEPRRRGTGSVLSAPVRRPSPQPTWGDRRARSGTSHARGVDLRHRPALCRDGPSRQRPRNLQPAARPTRLSACSYQLPSWSSWSGSPAADLGCSRSCRFSPMSRLTM